MVQPGAAGEDCIVFVVAEEDTAVPEEVDSSHIVVEQVRRGEVLAVISALPYSGLAGEAEVADHT